MYAYTHTRTHTQGVTMRTANLVGHTCLHKVFLMCCLCVDYVLLMYC
jgi:hypothetical protein